MKISNSFNRLYWGGIIKDIESNLSIINWNGLAFNIKILDKEGIHKLLKIMTFRGDLSLKELNSKEVVEYIEDIRKLLADNKYTLKLDDLEWERLLNEAKKHNI